MQENEEQMVDFDRLKQLVSERAILWREHALQRMNERRISKADVKAVIITAYQPSACKWQPDGKTRR